MRRFKSQLFTGSDSQTDDLALVACLDRDSAHIGFGATGDHVTKIQLALERLEGVDLAAERGTYGANTVTAVKAYKDSPKRQLLQPGQAKADQFVGKRTVRSLDEEIFLADNPGPVPQPTPPPVNPLVLSGAVLARRDVPLATRKVAAAIAKLKDLETTLILRTGERFSFREFDKLTLAAMRTHYRLIEFDAPVPPGAGETGRGFPRRPMRVEDVKLLIQHFERMQALFAANPTTFTDGSPVDKNGKLVAAAASLNSGKMIYSSHFRNFTDAEAAAIGPNSRAAILIHEGFHAVDVQQKSGDDALVHISEFDARYDVQGANHSIFNPSSYASFAAHVFKGSDPRPRFGLGPGSRAL